jgi:integrase
MRRLHFFRRGGVYCWRRRLPQAVARATGRTHVDRSLHTSDIRHARFGALRLSAAFEECMMQQEARMAAGHALSRADLDAVLDDLFEKVLGEVRRWAISYPPYIEARTYADVDEYLADGERQMWEHEKPDSQAEYWQHQMECGDFSEAEKRLPALLDARGIELPRGGIPFRELAFEGMQVGIAAYQEAAANLANPSSSTVVERLKARRTARDALDARPAGQTGPEIEAEVVSDRPAPGVGEGALDGLQTVADQYYGANAGSAWVAKTQRDAETSRRLMTEWFGDTPIDTITRQDARVFRTALGRIPKLHGKGRFAGLSMQESIDLADGIEAAWKDEALPEDEMQWSGFDDAGVARLTLKTANKHLTFARGLFEHAMEDTRLQANPFASLHYSKAEIAKQGGGHRPEWSEDDVQRLVRSPVWNGCAGPDRRDEPGPEIIRDGLFWVPLLALYAGLRLEEACQLQAADIKQIRGTPCISVERGPGRTVKSDASVRQVPVHSTLVRLGFLDYADKQRLCKTARLFPELKRSGPFKLYGYKFSKWFTEYRRSRHVDLYEPGMDFHALRKTFSSTILRKAKAETMVSVLLGHALQGTTHKHYFGGFNASDMVETVELVDYDVELSHLFVRSE